MFNKILKGAKKQEKAFQEKADAFLDDYEKLVSQHDLCLATELTHEPNKISSRLTIIVKPENFTARGDKNNE